jgi:CBS domain-containing protein
MPFEPQTAGRMMSLQFLTIHQTATIAEAIARLRATDSNGDVLALCAIDDDGRLTGVIPVERLVLAESGIPLRQVARERVVSVTPETSQDEVARIALRHRAWCIAVVDRERRPTGIIWVGNVLQSIREAGIKKTGLHRRLMRFMKEPTATGPAAQARYSLEARCSDTDVAHLRALLVRSLDPSRVRLGSFNSTQIGSTGVVRICAELIGVARNDRWIDQVAWRLSLEPGLRGLSWQIVPPDGEK